MINTNFINNKVALYTLIIGCFVVSVSMGIRQTYGIFFQFFETDLNITSTYFGLAIGVQAIVWGIFATIFGMIADKYGSNKVVMIALVTYAIGIYSLGNLNSQGFLFQINLGILVGIGLGGAAAPIIVPTVAKHFPNHNRAKAAGLVTAFASVGMFIYPIMSSTLFNYYSWGKILNIFVLILLLASVLSIFLKEPKADQFSQNNIEVKQSLYQAIKEAFGYKSYLFLMAGFFVCGFQITLVATHVPKYVIERGLDGWTGAAILSLIGLFNIFGSLCSGYLSTKMSKKIILSTIYSLRGLSIILFIFLPASNINSFIFGASFGFLWLSTVPATSGIVAHMFGTKYLGLLYGIVFLSHQIGSFFGAYLGGLFHDLYGSYDYAWYLAIALSVFAAIIHLPIKEQPVLRLKTE